MLRFGSIVAVERADGGKPTRRRLPPAAFWGTESNRLYRYPLGEATQPCPVTSGAGLLRFGSIGALERADGGKPTCRRLPPAAFGGRSRTVSAGIRPEKRLAGLLRFGSIGAVEGADGGKPTCRRLPPAAFWGTESNRLCRYPPGGATQRRPVFPAHPAPFLREFVHCRGHSLLRRALCARSLRRNAQGG